jgi:hypothetical protein
MGNVNAWKLIKFLPVICLLVSLPMAHAQNSFDQTSEVQSLVEHVQKKFDDGNAKDAIVDLDSAINLNPRFALAYVK